MRRFRLGDASDPLRLAALLLLAVLLLSYPWLAPGLMRTFVLGVPLVLVYLFVVWVGLILLVATGSREG